jgi:hypothetical protein
MYLEGKMMTPKENYLHMLRGGIPEYMPAYCVPFMMGVREELLTPQSAPDGPIVTGLGVTYVGNKENNYGAMPEPGKILIDDIAKWREKLKIRDITGRDWESYYKENSKHIDREKFCVCVDGSDYFLTLVSLMGFEGALMALYEEPEEVIELFTEISKFYTTVMKAQMYWLKPEIYILMDDDSAYTAPFISLDIYRRIIKPFHKLHADIALESGCFIDRHDCGKSEQFIEDWLEIGVRAWNPCQITNDCKGIKQKYGSRLALAGCWDSQGWSARSQTGKIDERELWDAMVEYVDTFAPGGGFTFAAGIGMPGPNPDEKTKHWMDFLQKFYNDYAKDWYKNHAN